MIPITNEENISYHKQKTCHICQKELITNNKKYCKVRDHCHYTRKYRGTSHNICSLRYKNQNKFL